MRILVLGSKGMLGTYLVRYLSNISSKITKKDFELFSASKDGKDLYCDFSERNSITSLFNEVNPDLVVNCIAITSLEYCEKNPKECQEINGFIPGYLAELCKISSSRFIQISTDHFYKDDGSKAHLESDKTFGLNQYAKSKLLAEKEINERGNDFLILRTSIVGLTESRGSYLDWILENLRNSKEVGLYFNAYTSLIHCEQLSEIIFQLSFNHHFSGLYNISNKNVFSKGDFYLSVAKKLGIKPIYKKEDLKPGIIERSVSCGLSPSKIESKTGLLMPSKSDLVDCIFNEQEGYKG